MKSVRLIVFCYFFTLPAIPGNTLLAQENYDLKNIVFYGNVTFSSSELLELMTMHGTSKIRQFILRKRPFLYNSKSRKHDIEKLTRFYQREGFLHVKITGSIVEQNNRKRTVKLRIHVTENAPILVGNSDFQLISDSSDNRQNIQALVHDVKSSLQLIPETRFREQVLQQDQTKLIEKFNNAGYPYVNIHPKLEVEEAKTRVNIIWQINSGPKCFFSDIQITGNERVAASLIHRQLAFKTGQLYQKKLIDKSQQQVFALGMFQIATISARLNQQRTSQIPVRLQIKEAARLTTKLGAGYGTEDNFRTFIDIRRLGFFGGARRLNLHFKYSGLEPYNINLKLSQPAFITANSTLKLNPFLRRQKEPGFTENRAGVSLSLNHQINAYLNSSITYTFEEVDLDTGSTSFDQAEFAKSSDLYNKSSVSIGFTRDNSSPLFSPNKGMFGALTCKISGLGFQSDYQFLKILLDIRRYKKLKGIVVAWRLKMGSIGFQNVYGFIPFEDRFFAGGSASVRGWARAQLGPVSKDNIPTGGNSLLEGNLEFRFPVYRIVSGVFFGDFGNVWRESNTYPLHDLHYALGFGLRFRTPFGPIRLDIAQPVFDTENKIQFHISVGQAF